MKYWIPLLLFLSLMLQSFAQSPKKKPVSFNDLDTTFNKVLKDHRAVGFAVAVVHKNQIIYSKGFGYRDLDKKLPVTPNTAFVIASCTKAFTSSIMGLLQKEGKIEYDKPVKDYVPTLSFYDKELNNNVTVRDIMCHRTGLPRHDFSWLINPTTRDSLLQRITYLEPSQPLRKAWQYNNWMFMLQGIATEKITGKTWEQLVQQWVFDPLGMKNSCFTLSDFEKQPEFSYGYSVYKDSIIRKVDQSFIEGMGPAGSIKSTATDLAKWVQTWIYGGKYNGKEILPASYVTEASSSQMIVAAGLPIKEVPDAHFSNYGFGWFLSSYKGHYRVDHGGNLRGFSANVSFFPTDSLGIIVLSNQNGSALPVIVRNTIADRFFKLPYYNWNEDRLKALQKAKKEAKETEKKKTSSRKTNTKPSHEWKDFEGVYHHPGYGNLVVRRERDSLFLFTQLDKDWLAHYHYDIFEPYDTQYGIDTTQKSNQRFQFITNTAGDIESMLVYGFEASLDKPLEFVKKPVSKPLTPEELKKYVAEFTLNGATIKTYIKNNTTLYLVVPNQPEYELTPIGQHSFAFAKVKGFSVSFDMKDNKESTALTIKQPNGNFVADRKK
jgi:CubicO group peptidase (beta-lactamase class C family)